MQTTTSRVLMSGYTPEPEREMLRKWADHVAANGGSFSIKHEWTENNWWTTWVINWPDGVEAPKGDAP
jgi:hypothetical protein